MIETGLFGFVLLPLVLLVLLVLGGLLLGVILLAARRSPPPVYMAAPTQLVAPVDREARLRVLEELSRKTISVEEAERRLAEMGSGVPQVLPTPPPPPQRTSSWTGCLVAVLVAFVLLIVAGMFAAALYFQHRSFPMHLQIDRPDPALEQPTIGEPE